MSVDNPKKYPPELKLKIVSWTRLQVTKAMLDDCADKLKYDEYRERVSRLQIEVQNLLEDFAQDFIALGLTPIECWELGQTF